MSKKTKSRSATLKSTGAALCLASGLLAGMLGTLLTSVTLFFNAGQHPWVRGLGTAFLTITIPLLILAGYWLDWVERDTRKPLDHSSNKNDVTWVEIK